jgi:hypothetical protein
MEQHAPERLRDLFLILVANGQHRAACRLLFANSRLFGRFTNLLADYERPPLATVTEEDGSETHFVDAQSEQNKNPLMTIAFYFLLSSTSADRFQKLYNACKSGIDKFAISTLKWRNQRPYFDATERAALGKLESAVRTKMVDDKVSQTDRSFRLPRTFIGKVTDEYTETGTQKSKLCMNKEVGWSGESLISRYQVFSLPSDIATELPDGPSRVGRKLLSVFRWHALNGMECKFVKHGGVGGHWGNEQGKLLDVAQSVALNDYLVSDQRSLQWLADLTLRVEEIIACALHEVDCNIDDGRIQNFAEFKDAVIMDVAKTCLALK